MKKILYSIGLPLVIIALLFSAIGCEGPVGPQGIQGIQGAAGATGSQGPQGVRGDTGEPGTGTSIVWMGTATSAPKSWRVLNYAYYNSTHRTSYIWDGNSWEILARDGRDGTAGTTGATGATGMTGATGPAGKDAEIPTPTPMIDGVISPGEWDGAVVIPVAGEMGTVSVIAYANYLYVLFSLLDSTDARLGQNLGGNDQISVNINPGEGAWGFPYDIIFETSADLPWNPKVNSGVINGWNTRWLPNNTQRYLPGGLESATTYTSAERVTEWKLPLTTIAPLLGETLKVGGAIEVGDDNSYWFPATLDWENPETFEDILVQ